MRIKPRVLVVDDKRNMVRLMKKVLRKDAAVSGATAGRDAIAALEAEEFDVVLCDLKMPDVDGIEVLRACTQLRPNTEFILMTAYASVDTAVEALRLGAYDYLTKPFDPEAGRRVVLQAIARAAAHLPDTLGAAGTKNEVLPGVIGRSESMQECASLVHRVAVSDSTVLLLGATGTGKERVARAIHALSRRRANRFVPVNSAAIPRFLASSSRASSSATPRVRSPAPIAIAPGSSRKPTRGRSSSTRSVTCGAPCRQSSRGCWRSEPFDVSESQMSGRSTFG